MKAFDKGDRVVWTYKIGPNSAYSIKYKHGTFVRRIHPRGFIKGTVSPTEAMVRFDGNKNDSRVHIDQLRYEQMTKKIYRG